MNVGSCNVDVRTCEVDVGWRNVDVRIPEGDLTSQNVDVCLPEAYVCAQNPDVDFRGACRGTVPVPRSKAASLFKKLCQRRE